jgi:phosphoribosylformylglycinamidine synthase
MYIRLDNVPYHGVKRDDKILFSESNSRFVVTVPKSQKKRFETVMQGSICGHVGFVLEKPVLRVKGLNGKDVIQTTIAKLKQMWKTPLEAV